MTGTERTPAQPPLSDFFESSDRAHRAPEAANTADTADTAGEFDDDEFGAAPAPQRRIPLVTGLLVLGVALALTFAAGVLVQKHHDAGTTAATPGAGAFQAGGFPGGAGAGFPNGQASSGASASGGTTSGPVVIGTVVNVKGKTMTVKDLGGKQHVVRLAATTTATKTITITVGALTPGTTVSVEGTTIADGSVGATAITTR
jgi:hypothetical protein